MTDAREIALDEIQIIEAAQMRVIGTDPGTVSEYVEAMEASSSFPPVILFHDGEAYWPADGFHRIEAARRIDRETIEAEIRQGSQRDAIMFACSANAKHGLRRTQADKRNAIETLLRDPEWSRMSDREIGKACAVDHKTVGSVRRELTGEFPTARTVRHGNGTKMDVAVGSSSIGSVFDKVLSRLSDEALIAECRRRGLEVRDV